MKVEQEVLNRMIRQVSYQGNYLGYDLYLGMFQTNNNYDEVWSVLIVRKNNMQYVMHECIYDNDDWVPPRKHLQLGFRIETAREEGGVLVVKTDIKEVRVKLRDLA